MRRTARTALAALGLALALTSAPAASAGSTGSTGSIGSAGSPRTAPAQQRVSVADPDDTSSALDLRRVTLRATDSRIVATLATYGAVGHDDLDSANGLYLRFQLAGQRYREVLVQSLSSRWTATICSGRAGATTIDRDCAKLRVKRAGAQAFRVVVPRRLVRPGATTYRWSARSEAALYSAGCAVGEGTFCVDRVGPEGGYLTWRTPRR